MDISRTREVIRDRMSKSEMEILRLISQGYLNKQIAYERGTVTQTVKNQVYIIMCKLDALNRTHAVMLAKEKGLLQE